MMGMCCRLLLVLATLFPADAREISQTEETQRNFDRLFTGKPEVISEGHQFAEGMAFDTDGNF